MLFNRFTLIINLLLPVALPVTALELSLLPSEDASIYDESSPLSDSKGPHLFSGQTASGHDQLRRALIRFDTSALPPQAILLSAELRLYVDNSPFAAPADITFALHPVEQFWQEGAANAGSPGGTGAAAGPGDPTWLEASFGSTSWLTAGGSYGPASATANGSFAAGDSLSFSSAQLMADVQYWRDNPAGNFGWIIVGEEGLSRSARRFASRENTVEPITHLPTLVLTYAVPEPQSILLFLAGIGLLRMLRYPTD